MVIDITKHLRNKYDYLKLIEYYDILIQSGYLDEKLVLTCITIILIKGINMDYIQDKEVDSAIKDYISKTKDLSRLTYELAFNDIIEDLNSEADSPKKLNVKYNNDPNNEIYGALIIKRIIDNKVFIEVLESYLQILKN